jgi:TonB family protein
MSNPSSTPPAGASREPRAAHLTVRPEGLGPRDELFLFQQQEKRIGNALGVSVASHIALLAIALFIIRMVPPKVYDAAIPDKFEDLIWLADPGPGGGGGGGGNKSPEPPKKVELPGKQEVTVPPPVPKPVEIPKPDPEPQPLVNIPAQTAAAAPIVAPGAIDTAPPTPTDSQGSGTGGGGGTGRGTGIGSGSGSGLGAGEGGGTGGGVYRPGNGVSIPRVLREVKPTYTAEAMRAKVQGSVFLECVILPDGSVGRVEVVKSLDPTFGLDQEAVKAARQWRFAPGTRFGEPVAVLVTIALDFTLR